MEPSLLPAYDMFIHSRISKQLADVMKEMFNTVIKPLSYAER